MSSLAAARKLSGEWIPLHFLYFVYYVFCRRDKMFMPDADKPAINASYSFTFLMGWPIAALLALLNHYTDWWPVWTQWWLAMHLPDSGQKTAVYAFVTVVVLIDVILYKALFGKRRYRRIMRQFCAYDPTQRTIAPALFFFFPLVPVAGLSVYAVNGDPVRGNLIIWSIIIANELVFRIWWRLWFHKEERSSSDAAK